MGLFFGIQPANVCITSIPYDCPSCLKTGSVRLTRTDEHLTLLSLPLFTFQQGQDPLYLCQRCKWTGKELKLTEEEMRIRDRLRCGSCGTKFENDRYRYCPYCGFQREAM
ncbi:hypothetical protein K493DRAFT_311244 [Basidiobolus meristosporus CBS 931.73]|uniref:Zinc-ribbon 15 domain-containing protein n=1 Tax=Basidiobolus meristosporus CBS 931.73 TaxID=1314790 RepID=A0A1Y1Z3C7_9FUNG|nr:hypothetical protein K493DRAFT_311244 [Basidiobolus meristosporus CBS 931.73]|eukprot:ORY04706.1 hypothetical protein K493DRAFT_311244 [Basidiobolus meristosporus CBS 931.73]